MRFEAADTREAAGRVPRPRTSFVGRERELGSAHRLLDCTRLLTLTGPGGSGKTRLSIALAARVAAGFRDGVQFAPKPGDRFPDVDVRDEHGPARLYHLLGGGRHVLIVPRAGVRSALERAGIGRYAGLVDLVDGDPGSGFALVRPDGILAVRGSAADTHRVVDYLRPLGGRGEPGPAAVLSEVVAP